MPALSVRCTRCATMIPTGLNVDRDAFMALTFTERTVECPACEHLQTWNLDDIDPSVFRQTK